jgi:hypothetical protein
LRLSGEEKER